MRPARVLARDRGRVLLADDHGETSEPLTDAVRHAVTGDWVARDAAGAVRAVLPRHGVLERPGHGPVAANVDLVLVAHALAEDDAVARVPRFLAMAAAAGCDAVVLVTKADLLDDPAAAVATVRAAVAGAAPVLPVSATAGADAVGALIGAGTTAALVGASGAGKSTLTNALVGAQRQATGAVRERDGRGRHVTVRRELVPLPGGGMLLDSPGVRLVPVAAAPDSGYADVAALARGCRFADCGHEGEPGCAVQAAIAAGALDPARLDALRRLEREAAHHAAREDAGAARARRDRQKRITRWQRQHYSGR